MPLKTIIQSIRPPFLLLTFVCCGLAFSLALQSAHEFEHWLMWPVLLSALFAHIAVNALNEYQDFVSGLDMLTVKTPFSGGSGALPDNPDAAQYVLFTALTALVISSGAGLFLILQQGMPLMLLGVLGVIIVLAYTRWINRMPWLCLIAPGMGFGLLMVMGSYLALTGNIDARVVGLSLVPFFLVNNLLLLNQYPDIEADKAVGRNHFPIYFGIEMSNKMYLIFLLSTFAVIAYLILNHWLSHFAWLVLLPGLMGVYVYMGTVKYGEKIGAYPHILAVNVMMTLLIPSILAVDIYFSI